MENKVNYTLVGLFVVVFLIAFIVISFWLSAGLSQQQYKTYLAYMDESVAGLSVQAPVKYNGVDVGFVGEIKINLADPQQVILTLKIDPTIPITVSTVATLNEQGITGVAYIGLRAGKNGEPLEALQGQAYPVIKTEPSFLVRLDTTLQSLTTNISSLSTNVKELVSSKNVKTITEALDNLKKFTSTLSNNDSKINESLSSLDVLLKNGAKASKELPSVLKSIKDGANAVNTMANDVGKASDNLTATLSSSKLAVQSIQTQVVPELYDTLNNINSLSENLKQFSIQLNRNPAILLKGKAPPRKGPGEQ